MFRLFDEFQLKINIRKKLIDVNFNHLWEFKDSETDYENFKIINLNDVFKIMNLQKIMILFILIYQYTLMLWKIKKDNNLLDESLGYTDIENRKVYDWLKYFDEIKDSHRDKNYYLDIIQL